MADITDIDALVDEVLNGKCIEEVTVDGRRVKYSSPLEKAKTLKCLQKICEVERNKKRTSRPQFIGLRSVSSDPCCGTQEHNRLNCCK